MATNYPSISILVTSLKASASNYSYSDWESNAPVTPHNVETKPETADEEEERASCLHRGTQKVDSAPQKQRALPRLSLQRQRRL
ncbi:hypothetical protein ACHAWX_004407 [Stephanocyclus meneghinianus]